MNKILIDNNNLLNKYIFDQDGNYLIEIDNINENIYFEVLDNVKVKVDIIGNNNNINLNIILNEESNMYLEMFSINGCINIDTVLNKRSNFKMNNSVLTNIDTNNKIRIEHKESESISNIKNHGFSKDKAKLSFNVEGIVEKDASKCVCNQDNQIIENENSFSTILPKLLIDNYDVDANHAAYVGEFREKDLFYLQSRGIDLETSKFLLLNAFLLGYLEFDQDIESKMKDAILKYFNKEVDYE